MKLFKQALNFRVYRFRYLLIVVSVLAFVLRFFRLGEVPPSLNWDEVSLGYNAYSIAQTLKDEHGVFLPFQYFAAFGDYKPPVYIYLAALFVKLLGPTDFAARIPSALFGTLTVVVTYFLVRRLFNNRFVAIIAAFFLAISIWHVNTSRAAFEANVATFFVVSGTWLFVEAIFGKWRLLPLSFLMFGLSFYTFNSPRVFVPLFLFALCVIYFRVLIKNLKWVILSFFVLGALLAPLVPHLMSNEGQLRYKEVNIFSDVELVETANQRIARSGSFGFANIIQNRRVLYTYAFLTHYFDEFDMKYLFFTGDENPKFTTRDTGQLYLFDMFLIPVGIYFLVKRKDRTTALLFAWFLLALVPASTAKETPHALRTLIMLPTYQIFGAYGLYHLIQIVRRRFGCVGLKIALFGFGVVVFYGLFYYLHSYYVHYPREFSQDWQYGYKETVEYVKGIEGKYDHIYVSDIYGRPSIFFLFYGRVQPNYYWDYKDMVVKNSLGFYDVYGFGKYRFGRLGTFPILPEKALYVGSKEDLKGGTYKILKEITFLDGKVAFYVMER